MTGGPHQAEGLEPVVAQLDGVRCGPLGSGEAPLDLCLRGAGRIHGLLAARGSGKSTLIDLLMGNRRPQQGRVRLWGRKPFGATLARVGWAGSGSPLATIDGHSPKNMLAILGQLHGLSWLEAESAASEELSTLELEEQADRSLKELAPGTLLLVGLAAALVYQPELLLLDDPFRDLDDREKALWVARVRKAAGDGTAVLWATSDPEELSPVAHHLWVLAHGRIPLNGTLDDLMASHVGQVWWIDSLEAVASWMDGPEVLRRRREGPRWRVVLKPGASPSGLWRRAADAEAPVRGMTAEPVGLGTLLEQVLRDPNRGEE